MNKQLELYLHIDAEDEHHGIGTLRVTAPEKDHISWEIDTDYIFTEMIDGEVWIGTNSISAPTSTRLTRRFPQGSYQAVIISDNGYEDTIDFNILDSVTYSERTPELFPDYDEDTGMISSKNPMIDTVVFRAYDEALNPLGALEIPIEESLYDQKRFIERSVGSGLAFFEVEFYNDLLRQWFRAGYYRFNESD